MKKEYRKITVPTRPYGGWINYRYLELTAREKKRLNFPRRERINARAALRRLNLRYKETVPFFQPFYHGWKNDSEIGVISWFDFVVWSPKHSRMFVMQFEAKRPGYGIRKRIQDLFNALVHYCKWRGLPLLILSRRHTAQEHEISILLFLRRLENR
jgi:hypothetical protein